MKVSLYLIYQKQKQKKQKQNKNKNKNKTNKKQKNLLQFSIFLTEFSLSEIQSNIFVGVFFKQRSSIFIRDHRDRFRVSAGVKKCSPIKIEPPIAPIELCVKWYGIIIYTAMRGPAK